MGQETIAISRVEQTGKNKGAGFTASVLRTKLRFPYELRKQIEDLCKALVKLEQSSSGYARRCWRTEFRLSIRHLEEAVVHRYPAPARKPAKRPRLDSATAMIRLQAAGWVPLTGPITVVHARCAYIGVKPRRVKLVGSEFRYWVPSWILLKATEAQYRRMKKDWRYRRAMLAKDLVVKQGESAP